MRPPSRRERFPSSVCSRPKIEMRFAWVLCACSIAFGQPARMVHRGGVVVDATTGEGIEGAVVRDGDASVTTDPAGRFQIDGKLGITVSKTGYVPRGATLGDQVAGAGGELYQMHIIVRLLALGTVSGLVLDAAGRPFAGAHIDLFATVRPPGVEAKTDTDGRFQAQLPPGLYQVCATPLSEPEDGDKIPVAACVQGVTADSGLSNPPVTIRLGEVAVYSILGRVRGARAGWGIQVHVESDTPTGTRAGFASWYFACTLKRDGSFVIARVPAGEYTVYASAGPVVQTAECDATLVPRFSSLVMQDDMRPRQPQPEMWSGERKVTLKGDVRDLVVRVTQWKK